MRKLNTSYPSILHRTALAPVCAPVWETHGALPTHPATRASEGLGFDKASPDEYIVHQPLLNRKEINKWFQPDYNWALFMMAHINTWTYLNNVWPALRGYWRRSWWWCRIRRRPSCGFCSAWWCHPVCGPGLSRIGKNYLRHQNNRKIRQKLPIAHPPS